MKYLMDILCAVLVGATIALLQKFFAEGDRDMRVVWGVCTSIAVFLFWIFLIVGMGIRAEEKRRRGVLLRPAIPLRRMP